MADVNVVESSTTPQETGVLTADHKAAWNKGETYQPKPQASAPAEKPQEVEKPETEKVESASDAGTDKTRQEKTPQAKPKLSGEERIAQLEKTIQRIREGMETKTKADPSPAPKIEAPKPVEAPKRPKLSDYGNATEGYDLEKYEDDMQKYNESVLEQKLTKREQEREAEQQRQSIAKDVQAKFSEAKQRYGDEAFDNSVKPLINTVLNDKEIPDAVRVRISRSPVMADLLYTIGSDEDAKEDFLHTAKTDVYAALDKIVITEGLVLEELKKNGKSKEAPEKAEKQTAKSEASEEPETPAQRKPAPKPATELGRNTAPEDAAMSAIRASGGSRLTPNVKAEWNRRALGK